MRKEYGPIIVEQTFSADIQTVWNSMTQIDLMRQWYFEDIPDFKPEVGFETQFNVENEGRNFLHLWKVTEVAAPHKITYNWKYDDYPGDSFVTFELNEHNGLTTLKLTHAVHESFPENIPEFSRESCLGGWDYFIRKRLNEYLEKKYSNDKVI